LRRKALLPLWLLTALSFTTFDVDTEMKDGIVNRYDLLSTYFLAAFAMLYGAFCSAPEPPMHGVARVLTRRRSHAGSCRRGPAQDGLLDEN
jgi:hypothetical protein